MTTPELESEVRFQLRKPVILIGAPSGAGKTVLSQKIIAGEFPMLAELCRSTPDDVPVRYDLKVLPPDPPRDRILIIECSTYNFDKVTLTDQWQRMLDLVRESEMVVHINLLVPKLIIVRQYFLRIFSGPKRLHPFIRPLQVSKYWTALIYLMTSRLSRSEAAWCQFGGKPTQELPSRVIIIHAQRDADNCELHLEGATDCLSGQIRTRQ